MSHACNDRGFSLIEALVALAVFAMAGVGLVQLQTQSLRTLVEVETRALASSAVQNRLTELLAADQRPPIGAREEQIVFARRNWTLDVVVQGGAAGAVRRITVSATPRGEESPAAIGHAFFAAPEERP